MILILLFGCYCCLSSFSFIATASANNIINHAQSTKNTILSGGSSIANKISINNNEKNNNKYNNHHQQHSQYQYPYENPIFSIRRGGSNVPKKLKKRVFGNEKSDNNDDNFYMNQQDNKMKEESNIINSLTSTNNNYNRGDEDGQKGVQEEEVIYVTKRDGSRELFDSQKVSGKLESRNKKPIVLYYNLIVVLAFLLQSLIVTHSHTHIAFFGWYITHVNLLSILLKDLQQIIKTLHKSKQKIYFYIIHHKLHSTWIISKYHNS